MFNFLKRVRATKSFPSARSAEDLRQLSQIHEDRLRTQLTADARKFIRERMMPDVLERVTNPEKYGVTSSIFYPLDSPNSELQASIVRSLLEPLGYTVKVEQVPCVGPYQYHTYTPTLRPGVRISW